MTAIESDLQHEIETVFGIQYHEIVDFKKLEASNHVYSFIVKNEKYVIKRLKGDSIMEPEREKTAYIALQSLNLTDDLVSFENGIKISKFLNGKTLSYREADIIDSLALLRKVHESGVSMPYSYDISVNMEKYISHCKKNSKRLNELNSYRETFNEIQKILDGLNVKPVLCHGDACVISNYIRLPDGSLKIIDWEQAGMADPLLDIAIATLHQGFENVDPLWCLHHYLDRIPKEHEYLRLFSFLALDSFALTAWCIYENPEQVEYYLNAGKKYSDLVLKYYRK
jgi:thiamine kinase-like enzyme